jgi:hypothetical protein
MALYRCPPLSLALASAKPVARLKKIPFGKNDLR